MKIQFKIKQVWEAEQFKDGSTMTPFSVEGLTFNKYNDAIFRFKGQIPKNQRTILGDLYYWRNEENGKNELHLGRWELD